VTSALLSEALAPLRAHPDRTAILLDIDGTLAPIVEHAVDARVPEPTRALLTEVARRYAVVACVSGRRASEARAMVAIGTISYLGSHGAELLRSGWTEAKIDPSIEEWTRRIHDFAREADSADLRRQRVRIEDKGPIVAFHWRGSPDADAARSVVDALAARAKEAGLHTHWGRKVLEVRAPVRFDKGAGITTFLAEFELDNVLYAGDDVTDVDAFRAIAKLAEEGQIACAVKIGVSSDETPPEIEGEADHTVQGTDGVSDVLVALLSEDQ
jgi:trehalose 6-phosphate phosphatase